MVAYDNDLRIIGRGRELFTILYEEDLVDAIENVKMNRFPYGSLKENYIEELKKIILSSQIYIYEYTKLYDMSRNDFGHYFRSLYQVIKLVDDATNIGDKRKYLDIIKAQLSPNELLVLFYNSLTDRGSNFKDLVVKYSLFSGLDTDRLLELEHKSLYSNSAYDTHDSEWK